MWSIAALVLVLTGSASCYITCPGGKVCSDQTTCCLTKGGYACCPVPNAVCCSDMAHCCPSGFNCNAITQKCEKGDHPWSSVPMLNKVAAEEPSSPVSAPLESDSSPVQSNAVESSMVGKVQCDNYYACPDGTTCCHHPTGLWFCCPYSPGRCCLDGYHCCPYGYDCDPTYTKCVRYGNLRYPFAPRQAPSMIEAIKVSYASHSQATNQVSWTALVQAADSTPQAGVSHCDTKFYCPSATSCCKGPNGKWGCCPFPLAKCCADGLHCCEYGYTCDPNSYKCRKWYSQIPSGLKDDANQD
ncbi:progranulin isoform X2 [Oncorhynchus mykiss]|uniref:Granulins domain-containing protein n=1 Tax=Oncorhynchus mykiss TaxID=8022 RepID=A0A8C7QAQ9_ONCMY|nr:progranulin isoform X2 [Oncorhynchus mykiss]